MLKLKIEHNNQAQHYIVLSVLIIKHLFLLKLFVQIVNIQQSNRPFLLSSKC